MSEPKAYPKMLYGEGGATMIVPDAAAEQAAGAGWADKPADEHRAQAATTQPLPSGQEPFVEAIAQRTAALVIEMMSKPPAPPPPEEPPAPKPAKAPKLPISDAL